MQILPADPAVRQHSEQPRPGLSLRILTEGPFLISRVTWGGKCTSALRLLTAHPGDPARGQPGCVSGVWALWYGNEEDSRRIHLLLPGVLIHKDRVALTYRWRCERRPKRDKLRTKELDQCSHTGLGGSPP
jgi:hypothetical protein